MTGILGQGYWGIDMGIGTLKQRHWVKGCRLITYWPARSMLTHFRQAQGISGAGHFRRRAEFRRNSRRASPVKVKGTDRLRYCTENGIGIMGSDRETWAKTLCFTMRAWPVARSIFDAPLGCERSERADNRLDNTVLGMGQRH